MKVLVDTSVWVDHFRGRAAVATLPSLLRRGLAVVHPFVVGELALGGVPPSALRDLSLLPSVVPEPHPATLALVGSARLAGRGIGWVDAHLLTCARRRAWSLWTLDARLSRAAERVGVPSFVGSSRNP